MTDDRPVADLACVSFGYGAAWAAMATAAAGFAAVAGRPDWLGGLLVLCWASTGPFAIWTGATAIVSERSDGRYWYLAWVGLALGLSGPAHVGFLVLRN